MKDNMILVKSNVDCGVVINIPEMGFKKVWPQRGAKMMVDRDLLEQAFYYPTPDYLFRQGILSTDDKTFMIDVGLIADEKEEPKTLPLTEAELKAMISTMTLPNLTTKLKTLTEPQLDDLGDYALEHYKDLKMDRVDIIGKATGRNLLKAIEFAKADEEQ